MGDRVHAAAKALIEAALLWEAHPIGSDMYVAQSHAYKYARALRRELGLTKKQVIREIEAGCLTWWNPEAPACNRRRKPIRKETT